MSIGLTGIILQYIESPYVVYLNIMLCQLYLSNTHTHTHTHTHTNTHNELHSVLKIQVYTRWPKLDSSLSTEWKMKT